MTPEEFTEFGQAAVDFLAWYFKTGHKTVSAMPAVEAGYLHHLLPDKMPEKPEHWKEIMDDLQTKLAPGLTNWQSPHYHAYFPAMTSPPCAIGEFLSSGLCQHGHTWVGGPALFELEVIVVDWLAKFLNMPRKFLNEDEGKGGGTMYGTAGEAILIAIVAAREQTVKRLIEDGMNEIQVRGRIVVYASDEANGIVEKEAKIAGLNFHALPTGYDGVTTGEILEAAIQADIRKGLFPSCMVATLGATSICAFDDIVSLAPVCKRNDVWLHADGAYAGGAFCLPELAHHGQQLEVVDSFCVNLYKMLRVSFDSTVMWYENVSKVEYACTIERMYFKYLTSEGNQWAPDYRNWGLALGRGFRALKVWITFRAYGAEGLMEDVRNRFRVSEYFEKLMSTDERVEIVHKSRLGMHTFRLKAGESETRALIQFLNEKKRVFLLPWIYKGQYLIRVMVGGYEPKTKDIDWSFEEIKKTIDRICPPPNRGRL